MEPCGSIEARLDFAQLEKIFGRAYVEGLLDPQEPDPELVAYLSDGEHGADGDGDGIWPTLQ